MSAGLVGSLVRRGMDVATTGAGPNGGKYVQTYELPVWAMLMIGATVAIFLFAMTMVEYTFGRLIPTLLMIESPQDAIGFEAIATEDEDNDASLKKGPAVETARPRLITSSFRSTIRLLRSKGGRRSRFRGFSIAICTAFMINLLNKFTSWIPFVGHFAAPVISAVLCSNLLMAWTHIVISEPSPKVWFRRLPPMSAWRKVAIPTAWLAITEEIATLVPLYVAMASGLINNDPQGAPHMTKHAAVMALLKSFGLLGLIVTLTVALVIPANVVLTRVQASLLSDAEETIVPFDRTFDGKVVPQIVGGSGAVTMCDAWRTFNWSARARLIKAYAKVFLIQVALSVLFFTTLVIQLTTTVSKEDWEKIKKSPRFRPYLN